MDKTLVMALFQSLVLVTGVGLMGDGFGIAFQVVALLCLSITGTVAITGLRDGRREH